MTQGLIKIPSLSVPRDPGRIVLINPTRFLGNLLLAGGLIQDLAVQCANNGQQLLLVLDAAFADLSAEAFPGVSVLYYPRRAIARASPTRKILLFARALTQIRAFKADLAFNIEEDATTSRLTQLSGARFRLGCSPARHRFAYDAVLPIAYAERPAGFEHRWHSYSEVFAYCGFEKPSKKYLNLNIKQCDAPVINKLVQHGRLAGVPLVAIHSGATKDYKKWPESAFISLCKLLIKRGVQPLLIGAGRDDAERCARLHKLAGEGADCPHPMVINMCDQLDLRELAQLFLICKGIVGNDSGPFHLAAAQGLPGVVIFGPSDAGIWGPIAPHARVLQKSELCNLRCSRRACYADYRCLREISADEVLENLLEVAS